MAQILFVSPKIKANQGKSRFRAGNFFRSCRGKCGAHGVTRPTSERESPERRGFSVNFDSAPSSWLFAYVRIYADMCGYVRLIGKNSDRGQAAFDGLRRARGRGQARSFILDSAEKFE
jgi:hypothetical protein